MCIICDDTYDTGITQLSTCNKITTIPLLPKLTWLWCWLCPALTDIPILPQLTFLNCRNCPALNRLPSFPQLVELDCQGCTSLITLPPLPQLKSLNCSYCTSLTTLPLFPQLHELDCSYCTSLTTLPLFPQLRELNSSGCPALIISSQFSDEIREFIMRNDIPLVDMERIHLKEETLGYGNFSTVSKGDLMMPDGTLISCAVKRQDINCASASNIRRELEALHRCRSQFVVPIIAVGIDSKISMINMCMPIAKDGTLLNLLFERPKPNWLSIQEFLRLMIDVTEGLEYIHSKGVLHLDIKPENILITENKHAILADFGCAKFISASYVEEDNAFVTRVYAPLEVLQSGKKQIWRETDVYSLAVTLIHCIWYWIWNDGDDYDPPMFYTIQTLDPVERKQTILKMTDMFLPHSASLCMNQALNICLHSDPYMRLSAAGMKAALQQVLNLIAK